MSSLASYVIPERDQQPIPVFSQPSSPTVVLLYGLVVFSYAVVFSLWQVEPVPLDVHLLAILVAATCFMPLARWYAQGSQGIPMFEMICFSYAVQFSMPVYLQPNFALVLNNLVPLLWEQVFQALVYVELGMVAMIVGYLLVKRISSAAKWMRVDLPLQSSRRNSYLMMAISVGLGTLFLSTLGLTPSNSGPFGAIIRVLLNQAYLALAILAYQVYGKEAKKGVYAFFLYSLLLVLVLTGLASGLLEQMLIPLVIFVTVYWHAKRTFPWHLVFVGAVAFLILNSVKIEYRRQAWFGNTDLSMVDRVTLWFDLGKRTVENMFGENETSVESEVRQSSKRFDLLHKFVHVIDLTPSVIPFYEGATYTYLLYGWIPRILWPDKPVDETNYKLDVDYGTTFPQDYGKYTGGIAILPEAYINFGVWGILISMMIQGMIFGLLDSLLNGPKSEGGRAIYLSLGVIFLNGIGSSTTMFSGLFQNVLANGFVLRLFATSLKATSENKKRDSIMPMRFSTFPERQLEDE